MAVVQDTYNSAPAIGFPGMIANGETSNRISRTVEDAAGISMAGVPVYRGAGDRGCTATVGTLATFLGFTFVDHGEVILPGGTADVYKQYRSANIEPFGPMYVTVGPNAVNDGDAVTIGKGGGLADGIGATAADATHIATGWVFDDTAAAGAVARIVRR